MHKCPVSTCTRVVGDELLMCGQHWRMVPPPMHRAVWTEYKKAPHSEAHLAACTAATDAVERQLKPTRGNHFGIKTDPEFNF